MRMDLFYPLRRVHGTIHRRIHQQKERIALRRRFRALQKENPRAAFLVLTPQHRNLGDHAIAQAEKKMLEANHIACIEITGNELQGMMRRGVLNAMNGFPIIVNGGGNLGTLWLSVEQLMRNIIIQNPRSTIYIMPNTIYYDQTPEGLAEMDASKKIYGKHKNLYLCAREQISYDLMHRIYQNVKLFPDVVLSLNESGRNSARKGCLLCLRSDREKTRTQEQENRLRATAAALFDGNVADTDMVCSKDISVQGRDDALDKKYAEFSGAELVITDRLHGMIFAAITGTPCIVIDSKSPKLRGCYAWVKDLDYIRFADNVDQIEAEFQKIPKTKHHYDNSQLRHSFDMLQDDLLDKFGWK